MDSAFKINSPWQNDPSLNVLFEALAKKGATPRLVGGGVRDALLGQRAEDEDIAINALPEDVMVLLREAGIFYAPTGLSHGTITAVLNKRPYQITSLRTDIKTFGRHAEVAFTEDWIADASRRDFTINALYADLDGTVYDPFGGAEDLKNHYVKFIGDPLKRIEEDYLRILRFFRFSAYYGEGILHPEGLAACRKLAPEISTLAKERITQEFLKFMKSPFVFPVLKALADSTILYVFLKRTIDFKGLKNILGFEEKFGVAPDPFLRLALSGVPSDVLFSSLKLSNKEKKLYRTLENRQHVTSSTLPALLYYFGSETLKDWILVQGAKGDDFDPAWFQHIDNWSRPLFPLTGEDLLQRGIQGAQIGTLLNNIEDWWVAHNFTPSREECLLHLDQLLMSN